MSSTYVICEKCQKMNRVQTLTEKQPICGSCKSPLPVHGSIVEARDSTLQKLIEKSPLPVVVDVWAPWCGPCRSFAPTFEEASRQFSDKVVFVKLNSDENPRMSNSLGVRGIPTILMFKNGKELTRQSGAMPRDYFAQWLNQSL